MRKTKTLLLLFVIMALSWMSVSPAGAAEPEQSKRGVLAGIAYLEGRGLSNMALFPVEWPHVVAQEFRTHHLAGTVTWLPAILTHAAGRAFSGLTDVVYAPIYYPVAKYDDSISVGMGWGEFPWQK